MENPVATVALDMGLSKLLDYAIPHELRVDVQTGAFVEVPLKSTFKKGTVIAIKDGSDTPCKPIHKVISTSLLSPDLLKLALWMADYYCTPLPDVLNVMLPSSVRGGAKQKEQYMIRRNQTKDELIELVKTLRNKSSAQAEVIDIMLQCEKEMFLSELQELVSAAAVDALVKKKILLKEKVQIDRSPLINEDYFPSKPKILTDDQANAYNQIVATLDKGVYGTHLLFGITGSGKTEVYLQAIQKALDLNKSALMLVPEIALTQQTIERFRSRFEGHIAVLHHRLSQGERHDEWKRAARGDAKIVIGARSAMFCPLPNIGLIVVDEEHESSYKNQEAMPCYHARDVAVMRGMFQNACVVLGSATPSLESYHNAKTGKYQLNQLNYRPDDSKLPKVHLVDMKREYEKKKGVTIFSEALLNGIEKRYKSGEQTLLFLNRRGYHTFLQCQGCGESVKCPSCDLTLTFHKKEDYLACHLCGYTTASNAPCPTCRANTLKFRGIGTEQVESALYAIFPEIRVLRLDADTTRHKGSHQKLIRSFRTGKADLLIGTQMIAKGLHFPEVTLVGILNSDQGLNIPDFRSGEYTFQLLTQVAGRAGRGILPGEVVLQTSVPENTILQKALHQDYEGFYQEEIESRKLFQFPPFTVLAKLRFTSKDEKMTYEAANDMRHRLSTLLPIDYEITAPDPGAYEKIKDQYRLQFLIKGPKIGPIKKAVQAALQKHPKVKVLVDINPTSTFF